MSLSLKIPSHASTIQPHVLLFRYFWFLENWRRTKYEVRSRSFLLNAPCVLLLQNIWMPPNGCLTRRIVCSRRFLDLSNQQAISKVPLEGISSFSRHLIKDGRLLGGKPANRTLHCCWHVNDSFSAKADWTTSRPVRPTNAATEEASWEILQQLVCKKLMPFHQWSMT